MDIICNEVSGGKEAGWTGSYDRDEVFPESVLNQIEFSSKRRLAPSKRFFSLPVDTLLVAFAGI
jgi:hypothetical protein